MVSDHGENVDHDDDEQENEPEPWRQKQVQKVEFPKMLRPVQKKVMQEEQCSVIAFWCSDRDG